MATAITSFLLITLFAIVMPLIVPFGLAAFVITYAALSTGVRQSTAARLCL